MFVMYLEHRMRKFHSKLHSAGSQTMRKKVYIANRGALWSRTRRRTGPFWTSRQRGGSRLLQLAKKFTF
jgi:hypothetical protein